MSVYEELMNERLKPEQVYKPPKQTPEQRAENLAAIRKHIADAKAKKAAAAAQGDQPATDTNSTEYEGPSLSETADYIKQLLEDIATTQTGSVTKTKPPIRSSHKKTLVVRAASRTFVKTVGAGKGRLGARGGVIPQK